MAIEKNRASQIQNIKSKRIEKVSVDELFDGISKGQYPELAKGITLIESTRPEDFEMANLLLTKCLSIQNSSLRIGITGVPGVGKSTFIESFGSYLTKMGKKVAVLAVDPTSSISKGSILGDKTRMEALVKDPNAFVRPSPAGDSLGGVSRKTRESIVLCEAAGFEIILIETVGVGQSETLVHSMVDFFLLLKLAGAGDELQGIKRGIIEMADAIIINKADGDNVKKAKLAKTEFARALHLYPPKENGWIPTVLMVSSIESSGLNDVWSLLKKFFEESEGNGHLSKNRFEQNRKWFEQNLENELKFRFFKNPHLQKDIAETLLKIEKNEVSPFHSAKLLVKKFLK
ncbi:methylmalonyl Co-A mutase-associated GTPase MeaB [Croceivirga thetidis]|uniref:methylmalonyl Co-A mutase-associated GTPase MeaB n=1 Tax=Croceivirga thetidis TaxID=2721623 RepID=UPI001B3000D1|nr:methylmalonyl Co-A mutase-associated GTPase MeaB [Croceivirga thetidis]